MTTAFGTAAVIVLNWNNAPDTIECLNSLSESRNLITPVVVDNGSTDGSLNRIRSAHPDVTVLETGSNLGYAGGNNFGLRYALARDFDVVAVLNNDTVAEPHLWSLLLSAIDEGDARSKAVSPRIMYADNPDRAWFEGGVWDRGWPRHEQPDELPAARQPVTKTALLSGCCILAHRDVWASVGPFDEGFFLIFEDSDWSARATSLGVELAVVLDAKLLHKVSSTFGATGVARVSGFYYARNGFLCVRRHQRRHLASFTWRRIIHPALRDVRHGRLLEATALLTGLLGALSRHSGQAPGWLVRLAVQQK